MSRKVIHQDERLTVVSGIDHMLGAFYQIFDKEMQYETEEGEGLVYDWSQGFGTEVNLTGHPNSLPPLTIVNNYIEDCIS
jgi:hypothetical protein